MGVMRIGKNRYWCDQAQDEVDNYLNSFGFDICKAYSDAKLKAFFKRAYNHKHMFWAFSEAFENAIGRSPLKSEYKRSIIFGLGSPSILER